MSNEKMNIVIAGVGGQGIVLASRVLAQAAINKGWEARTAETIGMAQREGSVQSHVRINCGEFSPLVGRGQADVLMAFEMAEAARSVEFLKPAGKMLVNEQYVSPVSLAVNAAPYPKEEIKDFLRQFDTKFINASETAIAAGSFRAVNSVMLGALTTLSLLPFTVEEIEEALLKLLPSKLHEINKKAFLSGTELKF